MNRNLSTAVALGALLFGAGCTISSAGPGYEEGELGNGGFLFTCDDSVACEDDTNDASAFPSAVSLGATFAVRYVPQTRAGTDIRFNESEKNRGITVSPTGQFISSGPDGFVGIKEGYGTLASRDASGRIIDYVTLRVAKPDALVVYEASLSSGATAPTPVKVDNVELRTGSRRSYRVRAQENHQDLAGSLRVQWESDDESIVAIDSVQSNTVTVTAKKEGTTKLHATGGTFVEDIVVTVMP